MYYTQDGAEITLFVLVASVTRDPGGYTAFGLPDGQVVSQDEALAFIRSRERPLICSGHGEKGRLSIEVSVIREDERESHLVHADSQFDFFESRLHSRTRGHFGSSGCVIALSSPQGTLYITDKDFQNWLHDYFVPNRSIAFSRERSPDPKVAAVLRVGPGGGFSIHTLPRGDAI